VERSLAVRLLRDVPPLLHAVLARLAAQSSAGPLIEALAHGLVRRLHPSLTLVPDRLSHLSQLVIELLRAGESRSTRQLEDRRENTAGPISPAIGKSHRQPPPSDRRSNGKADRQPSIEPASRLDPPSAQLEQTARLAATDGLELASSAAGLFLALVPLIRLGWREWLAGRPDWLLYQPGTRLLQAIAEHHRVPASDAVWSVLPEFDRETEAPAELEAALALWRKGLDGWLRRTARLTLAELVVRRGWLLPGPDTTIVRFPLDGIDIRLRRRALDSDPGWVDWLGHAYRFVYRDRPLTGPQPS
jgi:hypothetical protein